MTFSRGSFTTYSHLIIILRRIRMSKDITMETLSFDADISYTTLSRIELGSMSPSIDILKSIADAQKIQVAELFDFFIQSKV